MVALPHRHGLARVPATGAVGHVPGGRAVRAARGGLRARVRDRPALRASHGALGERRRGGVLPRRPRAHHDDLRVRAVRAQPGVRQLPEPAGGRGHRADALQRVGAGRAGALRGARPAARSDRGRALDRADPRPDTAVRPAAAGPDGDAAGPRRAARRRPQGLRARVPDHLHRTAQLVQDPRLGVHEHDPGVPGGGGAVHHRELRADQGGRPGGTARGAPRRQGPPDDGGRARRPPGRHRHQSRSAT